MAATLPDAPTKNHSRRARCRSLGGLRPPDAAVPTPAAPPAPAPVPAPAVLLEAVLEEAAVCVALPLPPFVVTDRRAVTNDAARRVEEELGLELTP